MNTKEKDEELLEDDEITYTKKEIKHKKTIFTFIRTGMELLGLLFLFFNLNQGEPNGISYAFAMLFYLLFAYVPHILVKNITFGEATISNFLAGVLYSVFSLFIVMGSVGISGNQEAAGWSGALITLLNMIFVPANFVINLIVDLIAVKVIQKRRNEIV